MGNGLRNKADKGVELLAAATMGVDKNYIEACLKMTPEEFAAKYGIKLYDCAEEMIAAEKLDTVVLNGRHSEHANLAEKIAACRVNIFIPKTFATTVADARRIADAGRRHGVKIYSGPSATYLPEMVTLKKCIGDGLIGKPFSMRICHHHGVLDVFGKDDWYRLPEEGGPELSLGWYGIDLIMGLFGEDVKNVYASYGNFTTPDSPFMDAGRITMTMAGGGFAAFDMYFCNRVPYPSWQAEIIGDKGVLSLHRVEGSSGKTAICADTRDGHKTIALLADVPPWELTWADDLLAGKDHLITAERSARITEVSIAARESAEKGIVVNV